MPLFYGHVALCMPLFLWGTVWYSDVSFLWMVFILYSERSFLQTVFSPLIQKAYDLKGHCSKNFNPEMPLFRTVFDTKGFYSEWFLSRLFLIRTVLIPKVVFLKFRIKTFRIKNCSDQKTSWCQKNSPKLWLLTVVTCRKIINLNCYFSEWYLFRKVFILNFWSKNLLEKKLFGKTTIGNKTHLE